MLIWLCCHLNWSFLSQNLEYDIKLNGYVFNSIYFFWFKADANYSLSGDILGLLPIFGDGPMFLEVYDLDIAALAGLTFSPDGQYIQVVSKWMSFSEWLV